MSFLEDYHLYTGGDEVPPNYHIGSAIATLASIMGRRVWVDWGRYRFYPNIYIVMLGPPGNGKTSALSVAKGIIRELANVPFSAEAQTKESLCKEMPDYEVAFRYEGNMVTQTPLAIFVTELSHFLGPASGHMIDFLTTVYDQDVYDTKTKGKGNDLIIGPCITMLACTTPAWITTYLKSDIISGGFTRRAVFINEFEGTNRIPFPEYTKEQLDARARIIAAARKLQEIVGPFQFTPAGREWLAEWYTGHARPENDKTRWYYRTKHVQLLKIAMMIACSEGAHPYMDTMHLRAALGILEKFETNLATVFVGMGRNELFAVSERIVDTISTNGGILPEKKLKQIFYQDADYGNLEQIFMHLVNTDRVKRVSLKMTGDSIPRVYIGLPETVDKLAKAIADRQAKKDPDGGPSPSQQSSGPSGDSGGGSSPPSDPPPSQ